MPALLPAIACSLMFCASCKKDHDHDDDASDTEKPVISLTSPLDMSTYTSGDTVWIKGLVTDKSLHELSITLKSDKNGAVLYSSEPVVHDFTSYTLNTCWKSMVTEKTNATLTVKAVDHHDNTASQMVSITLNP